MLKKNWKKIAGGLALLTIIVGYLGYSYFKKIKSPLNLTEDKHIYLPKDVTFQGMIDSLKQNQVIEDLSLFTTVAEKRNFKKAEPGYYHVKKDMSMFQLITNLRNGYQSEISLTFNNCREIQDVAGEIAKQIEVDSLSLLNHFLSEQNLSELSTNKENIITYFIPNTYNVYWNSTPEEIMARMKKEHGKFWNKSKLTKAKKYNLSPAQVYTLASIVHQETKYQPEKSTVAGLYLNRLRDGWALQSDPTSVFGIRDFDAKRVTHKHTKNDNPYNTYMHPGLPPGPIYMPDVSTILSVLDPKDHKYFYMCADPDKPGHHKFTSSLAQHERNANYFRRKTYGR